MKKNIILILIVFSILSCNDDFLERYPKAQISKENFFKTSKDLEIYTNGFYGGISGAYDDIGTDNISTREAKDATWDLLHGSVSPLTQKGWSWGALRSINFFLENSNAESAKIEEIRNYQGIAKFFRAQFYIKKVKLFSDVPWYSKPLSTTDKELLFKKQDARGVVVDSIIKDLQFATNNITLSNSSKTRISKWAALASLARFALYEGTFRKYGMKNSAEATYLSNKNASDYTKLLEIARDASQKIMNEGGFSLSGNYDELFNSNDLTGNSEIILFEDYKKDTRFNNSFTRLDWQYNLSQNLLDEYLKIDGTAYTRAELNVLEFRDSFKDRDPRAKSTISYPGWTSPASSSPHVAKIAFGGIGQIKFTPKEADGWSWGKSYNDIPIFRYAEILLINAEANAELGTLSEDILNNTINLIRDRAGLAKTAHVKLNTPIDPILNERYPNIDAANKGATLEIRRERRIELACEGLRYGDLMRWHVGDAILTSNGKPNNIQRGIYVPKMTVKNGAKYTLLEVTGDDKPDIIIAATADDLAKAAIIHKGLNKISLDENISLTNGDEGHIIWDREVSNPGTFVEPKYYYRPVPQSEILINKNLVQHEFWKN